MTSSIVPPTVALVRARLDLDPALLDEFARTLAGEEAARAEGMRTPLLRRRLIADLGWRRRLLAERVGEPPVALVFDRDAHGKPHLREHTVHFSASRSDDIAWYAISEAAEVGIDVEREDPSRALESLARRLLTPRERAIYDALPEPERRSALNACWVCKEAAGKALGAGLVFPLTGLEAWAGNGTSLRAGGLSIHQLAAGEGRAAAVAVRTAAGEDPALEPVRDLPEP